MRINIGAFAFLAVITAFRPLLAAPPEELLIAINKVGPDNAGQRAAFDAWNQLVKLNPESLPILLAGVNDARPLAANWIRSAIDAIAEKTLSDGGKLPIAELETFLANRKHDPHARRLAYELIVRADSTAPDRLLPAMLDDPSLELRRDAVARVLESAEKVLPAGKDAAADLFEHALKAGRDEDQIKLASDKLKELGRKIDLARHFGFVLSWKLIGPFDNTGEKGLAVAYPPEEKIDFSAELSGKSGNVKWIDHTTAAEYGTVDLNAALGKNMGAVAYAAAEFYSDNSRPVDLRLGTDCANKIWLNGKLLHETEVYHALTKLDQYVGKGKLRQGQNVILLKICQNEQTESWAQDWKFQLRVCDEAGTAVLSTDRDGEK